MSGVVAHRRLSPYEKENFCQMRPDLQGKIATIGDRGAGMTHKCRDVDFFFILSGNQFHNMHEELARSCDTENHFYQTVGRLKSEDFRKARSYRKPPSH